MVSGIRKSDFQWQMGNNEVQEETEEMNTEGQCEKVKNTGVRGTRLCRSLSKGLIEGRCLS